MTYERFFIPMKDNLHIKPLKETALAPEQATLLYIAGDGRFFASHFAHLAKAAQQHGYRVAVAACMSGANILSDQGFILYPQKFERAGRSFFHMLKALPHLAATLRKTQADLVHVIGLQNILFALPALFFARTQVVLAPTGLGQFWVENGFKALLARATIRFILRCLPRRKFSYLFENDEDAAALGLSDKTRRRTVGGAGIDEKIFLPMPAPPALPVRAAVVARMLRHKGILETVHAVRQVRQAGIDIVLDLWGAPDPANRSSLTEEELRALSHDGVTWRGISHDVRKVWEKSHIAILLSTREGLPKALLEAAACARPILASDVPGCRALVRNRQEGLLVPLHDDEAIIRALTCLARDENLRKKYGLAARERILQGFTQDRVASDILEFYRDILARAAGRLNPSSATITP